MDSLASLVLTSSLPFCKFPSRTVAIERLPKHAISNYPPLKPASGSLQVTAPSMPIFHQAEGRFAEGFLPQQKLIDGRVFPKILLPKFKEQREDIVQAVQVVQESRHWIEEQLRQHGAIIFRDFHIKTAEDFDAFVEAFGWQEFEYVGMAPRTQIVNRVYTANESPPEEEIFFHHEMCRIGVFPSKVFFFCEIAPTEGGQTPMIMSHKVTERVEREFPDFVKNIEEKGLSYSLTLSSSKNTSSIMGQSWQGAFRTQDKKEAEKRAAEGGARLEWLPDNRVKFIQGPYKSIRTFYKDGKKAWFNTLTGLYNPLNDAVTYGDGSQLPEEPVAASARIEQEEAVDINWHTGDVMLLDNFAVMHGRRRCKSPRRVLVSLCA